MRLFSIEYSEFENENFGWVLEEFSLIDVNLIVGKNSAGKSRLLRLISGLARLIDGTVTPANLKSCKYKAIFLDEIVGEKTNFVSSDKIVYEVDIFNGKVRKEVFSIGDKIKLDRSENTGKMFYEEMKQFVKVHVPEFSLALTSRRDAIQHKYLEGIHAWSTTLRYFQFANSAIQEQATAMQKNQKKSINASAEQNIHLQLKAGKDRFNRDLISSVCSDMRRVGYEITDFGLMPLEATGLILAPVLFATAPDIQTIYVIESGINKKLSQHEMSSGMFRALLTLIQINLFKLEKKRGCILIDDVGEGLDFDRATKLISIVIEKAEAGFSQLIMTTNDRFVMNKVPLKYWSVMSREAGNVKMYTPRNSKDKFDEFEEIGFNNFDFFAKNYFSTGVRTH